MPFVWRVARAGAAVRAMRRLGGFAAATVIVICAIPVPAGAAHTGTITGRALDGTTGKPQSGVRIRLQGGDSGGDRITRWATTGADGRYSFKDLTTGDGRAYVVDAYFDGGFFPGRALRLPADTARPPVIDTTVKVWPTTTDPTVIRLAGDDLFAIPSKDGLGVIESVSVLNASAQAYIGRGGTSDAGPGSGTPQSAPSLGFSLPDGATQVQVLDSNLDVPRLVAADFGFAMTVAVPPGESRITFGYRLDGETSQFDLSRNALYPTEEMSVYAKPPLTVQANRLTDAGERTISGTRYRLFQSGDPLESGDPVQVLVVADAGRPIGLFAGVAGFVVLVIVGLAIGLRRRRRPAAATQSKPPGDRDALLTEIARLDLEFENGGVSRGEWERERARLKKELTEQGSTR